MTLFRPLPPPDPGPGSLALLRRLIHEEGRRHLPSYGLAFASMAVMAAATGLTAYLMKDVINRIFIAKELSSLSWIGGAVLGLFAVKGVASYLQETTMARVGNQIIAGVQTRMFDHLLAQDMPFFGGRHSTELIAQNSFIANSAKTALSLVITSVGRDALSVLALTVVMLIQDPILSIAALLIAPPAIAGARYLSRRVKSVVRRQFRGFAAILQIMQETSQGIRVVKSFDLEGEMRRRMAAAIADFRKMANRIAELSSRSSPLMETLGGVAVAMVVVYGGWRVIVSGQTPGQFFSFITALLLAYDPAKRLAKFNVDLNAALAGVRMLYEFLDTPEPEGAIEDAKPAFVPRRGRIVLDAVGFGYRPEEPVLQGLSLTAEAGATTALVGPSGGGKSTVMNLILRFFEPQQGAVTIDGQAILDVSVTSLRAAIGYVGQDVFLFAGTIRDNIAFGRPGASDGDVVEAARAAHAHDFIMAFDDGYDSEVGERGLQLSGGQRARIAIARAILKDAPIILLDEATAALDSESERAVQDALDGLSAGRTTLVIAHRLQTIQRADKICVIERGRVVEEGRHEELLALQGRYFHFHAIQFREERLRASA
jgi:subfamily B ATP-binding cassette protein MsbA